MPSRVLETETHVDDASVSLRPGHLRRWTSIELGHQQIVATARKRVSATTVPLASLVNNSPSTPSSSENQSRNVNGSTIEASPETPSGSRNRKARPSSTLQPSTVPLLSGVGSYFLPQPGASGIEARSPANKRAPASRSSHGIETSNGPPPALSTQRSYSTEDAWRYPAPADQLALRPQLTHRALQGLAAGTTARTNSSNSTIRLADVSFDRSTDPTPSENISNTHRDIPTNLSDMSTTPPRLNDHFSEPDQDRTIRISESTAVATVGGEGKGNKEGAKVRPSQEDLFLDLAHTDVSMQDLTAASDRVERRRSRKAISDQRQPSPHAYQASATPSARHPSSDVAAARQEVPLMASSRSPQWYRQDQVEYTASPTVSHQQLSRDRTYAASAHPLESRIRSGVVGATPKAKLKSVHGALHSEPSSESDPVAKRYGRLSISDEVQSGPRTYKQSSLSYSTNGFYSSSPLTGRSDVIHGQESPPETPHVEGTESTASLTAPSTVWDELDDLKSRIRKLELTGRLPSSSGAALTNAAMANNMNERPHTATTSATTISSSPREARLNTTSPDKSVVEVHGVHPILRTALAKAQPFVGPSIYRSLEATASDALSIAAMTGAEGSQVSMRGPGSFIAGSASTIDRQLRRKADSMCRGLTELCIALSEDTQHTETVTAVVRPGSRDSTMSRQQHERSVEKRIISRETSQEPATRSGSRLLSRLEARRTSMMGLSNFNAVNDGLSRSPEDVAPATAGRLDRRSSIVQSRRNHDEEDDTTTRAPSRAMTEIRPSPRNRPSREYTSQRPLPSLHQRSPSVQSSLPASQNYFTPAPSTPVVQPGHRRYWDRSAPSSADSARLAEARQQRLASLEQPASAGRQRARSFGPLGAIVARGARAQIEADPDFSSQEDESGQ